MNKKVILISISILGFLLFMLSGVYSIIQLSNINNDVSNLVTISVTSGFVGFIFMFIHYKTRFSDYEAIEKDIIAKDKELEEQRAELKNKILEIEAQSNINTLVNEISQTIQKSSDLKTAAPTILEQIANALDLCQGVLYTKDFIGGKTILKGIGTYAYHKRESELDNPEIGVGLVGQVAKEKSPLYIKDLPDGYIDVISGLGQSKPGHLAVVPLIYNNEIMGVIELASFHEFTSENQKLFLQLGASLGTGIHFFNQEQKIKELESKPQFQQKMIEQEVIEVVKTKEEVTPPKSEPDNSMEEIIEDSEEQIDENQDTNEENKSDSE